MALPVNITINYTIDGGITPAADGGDILHVYLNGVELSTDNGLHLDPAGSNSNRFMVSLSGKSGSEAFDQLVIGGELIFILESINSGGELFEMGVLPFDVDPGRGIQSIQTEELIFFSSSLRSNTIIFNEVFVRHNYGLDEDYVGTIPQYIELYNTTTEDIVLCDYKLLVCNEYLTDYDIQNGICESSDIINFDCNISCKDMCSYDTMITTEEENIESVDPYFKFISSTTIPSDGYFTLIGDNGDPYVDNDSDTLLWGDDFLEYPIYTRHMGGGIFIGYVHYDDALNLYGIPKIIDPCYYCGHTDIYNIPDVNVSTVPYLIPDEIGTIVLYDPDGGVVTSMGFDNGEEWASTIPDSGFYGDAGFYDEDNIGKPIEFTKSYEDNSNEIQSDPFSWRQLGTNDTVNSWCQDDPDYSDECNYNTVGDVCGVNGLGKCKSTEFQLSSIFPPSQENCVDLICYESDGNYGNCTSCPPESQWDTQIDTNDTLFRQNGVVKHFGTLNDINYYSCYGSGYQPGFCPGDYVWECSMTYKVDPEDYDWPVDCDGQTCPGQIVDNGDDSQYSNLDGIGYGLDECGICLQNYENGELIEDPVEWNISCTDCSGIPNGNSWESDCGCVPEGNSGDDCDDCGSVPNGDSELDDCGVCNGGNADMDCAGECFGDSWVSDCGCVAADNSGDDCDDCDGTPNGDAYEDNCGVCVNYESDECVQDCSGTWGGDLVDDECGVCGGDNSSCADCAGVPNGDNWESDCGCVSVNNSGDDCDDCAGAPNGEATYYTCDQCGDSICITGDTPCYNYTDCGDNCGGSTVCNGSYGSCPSPTNGNYNCDGTTCSNPDNSQDCSCSLPMLACGCGDASSCNDECGVPNGDSSTCEDICGEPNGNGCSCGEPTCIPYCESDVQYLNPTPTCSSACTGSGCSGTWTDCNWEEIDCLGEGCNNDVCNIDANCSGDNNPNCIQYDDTPHCNVTDNTCYCDGTIGCDLVCRSGETLDECGNCGIWSGGGCDESCDLGCGCGEDGPSGCDNNCGSILELDDCGVCGGDNSSCADCAGVPNGDNVEDNCGTCDNVDSNDCVQDCFGIWGGNAAYDECGICGGDNSSCADCDGVPNGNNIEDNCGVCNDDPIDDCVQDCAGTWGGSLENDECGVCGGDNSTCLDCSGVPNGDDVIDECGICGGDGIPIEECDCYGNVIDECGICGGDNSTCEDCNGVPNGDSELDNCGICGGDNETCGTISLTNIQQVSSSEGIYSVDIYLSSVNNIGKIEIPFEGHLPDDIYDNEDISDYIGIVSTYGTPSNLHSNFTDIIINNEDSSIEMISFGGFISNSEVHVVTIQLRFPDDKSIVHVGIEVDSHGGDVVRWWDVDLQQEYSGNLIISDPIRYVFGCTDPYSGLSEHFESGQLDNTVYTDNYYCELNDEHNFNYCTNLECNEWSHPTQCGGLTGDNCCCTYPIIEIDRLEYDWDNDGTYNSYLSSESEDWYDTPFTITRGSGVIQPSDFKFYWNQSGFENGYDVEVDLINKQFIKYILDSDDNIIYNVLDDDGGIDYFESVSELDDGGVMIPQSLLRDIFTLPSGEYKLLILYPKHSVEYFNFNEDGDPDGTINEDQLTVPGSPWIKSSSELPFRIDRPGCTIDSYDGNESSNHNPFSDIQIYICEFVDIWDNTYVCSSDLSDYGYYLNHFILEFSCNDYCPVSCDLLESTCIDSEMDISCGYGKGICGSVDRHLWYEDSDRDGVGCSDTVCSLCPSIVFPLGNVSECEFSTLYWLYGGLQSYFNENGYPEFNIDFWDISPYNFTGGDCLPGYCIEGTTSISYLYGIESGSACDCQVQYHCPDEFGGFNEIGHIELENCNSMCGGVECTMIQYIKDSCDLCKPDWDNDGEIDSEDDSLNVCGFCNSHYDGSIEVPLENGQTQTINYNLPIDCNGVCYDLNIPEFTCTGNCTNFGSYYDDCDICSGSNTDHPENYNMDDCGECSNRMYSYGNENVPDQDLIYVYICDNYCNNGSGSPMGDGGPSPTYIDDSNCNGQCGGGNCILINKDCNDLPSGPTSVTWTTEYNWYWNYNCIECDNVINSDSYLDECNYCCGTPESIIVGGYDSGGCHEKDPDTGNIEGPTTGCSFQCDTLDIYDDSGDESGCCLETNMFNFFPDIDITTDVDSISGETGFCNDLLYPDKTTCESNGGVWIYTNVIKICEENNIYTVPFHHIGGSTLKCETIINNDGNPEYPDVNDGSCDSGWTSQPDRYSSESISTGFNYYFNTDNCDGYRDNCGDCWSLNSSSPYYVGDEYEMMNSNQDCFGYCPSEFGATPGKIDDCGVCLSPGCVGGDISDYNPYWGDSELFPNTHISCIGGHHPSNFLWNAICTGCMDTNADNLNEDCSYLDDETGNIINICKYSCDSDTYGITGGWSDELESWVYYSHFNNGCCGEDRNYRNCCCTYPILFFQPGILDLNNDTFINEYDKIDGNYVHGIIQRDEPYNYMSIHNQVTLSWKYYGPIDSGIDYYFSIYRNDVSNENQSNGDVSLYHKISDVWSGGGASMGNSEYIFKDDLLTPCGDLDGIDFGNCIEPFPTEQRYFSYYISVDQCENTYSNVIGWNDGGGDCNIESTIGSIPTSVYDGTCIWDETTSVNVEVTSPSIRIISPAWLDYPFENTDTCGNCFTSGDTIDIEIEYNDLLYFDGSNNSYYNKIKLIITDENESMYCTGGYEYDYQCIDASFESICGGSGYCTYEIFSNVQSINSESGNLIFTISEDDGSHELPQHMWTNILSSDYYKIKFQYPVLNGSPIIEYDYDGDGEYDYYLYINIIEGCMYGEGEGTLCDCITCYDLCDACYTEEPNGGWEPGDMVPESCHDVGFPNGNASVDYCMDGNTLCNYANDTNCPCNLEGNCPPGGDPCSYSCEFITYGCMDDGFRKPGGCETDNGIICESDDQCNDGFYCGYFQDDENRYCHQECTIPGDTSQCVGYGGNCIYLPGTYVNNQGFYGSVTPEIPSETWEDGINATYEDSTDCTYVGCVDETAVNYICNMLPDPIFCNIYVWSGCSDCCVYNSQVRLRYGIEIGNVNHLMPDGKMYGYLDFGIHDNENDKYIIQVPIPAPEDQPEDAMEVGQLPKELELTLLGRTDDESYCNQYQEDIGAPDFCVSGQEGSVFRPDVTNPTDATGFPIVDGIVSSGGVDIAWDIPDIFMDSEHFDDDTISTGNCSRINGDDDIRACHDDGECSDGETCIYRMRKFSIPSYDICNQPDPDIDYMFTIRLSNPVDPSIIIEKSFYIVLVSNDYPPWLATFADNASATLDISTAVGGEINYTFPINAYDFDMELFNLSFTATKKESADSLSTSILTFTPNGDNIVNGINECVCGGTCDQDSEEDSPLPVNININSPSEIGEYVVTAVLHEEESPIKVNSWGCEKMKCQNLYADDNPWGAYEIGIANEECANGFGDENYGENYWSDCGSGGKCVYEYCAGDCIYGDTGDECSGNQECAGLELGSNCIPVKIPLHPEITIDTDFEVSVIDTTGPDGSILITSQDTFGISNQTWLFQFVGNDDREVIGGTVSDVPIYTGNGIFTITYLYGIYENVDDDDDVTGCTDNFMSVTLITDDMYIPNTVPELDIIVNNCSCDEDMECQNNCNQLFYDFYVDNLTNFNSANGLPVTNTPLGYDDESQSFCFEFVGYDYESGYYTNSVQYTDVVHNPNYGGWMPKNAYHMVNNQSGMMDEVVWKYEIRIEDEDGNVLAGFPEEFTDWSNEQLLWPVYWECEDIDDDDINDECWDTSPAGDSVHYTPPPNDDYYVSNVSRAINTGYIYTFDTPGKYKIIGSAYDLHYDSSEILGTNTGSIELELEIPYIIPIVQTVGSQYLPWQGINIPNNLTGSIRNDIDVIDYYNKDTRIPLGCFYDDDDVTLDWGEVADGQIDGPMSVSYQVSENSYIDECSSQVELNYMLKQTIEIDNARLTLESHGPILLFGYDNFLPEFPILEDDNNSLKILQGNGEIIILTLNADDYNYIDGSYLSQQVYLEMDVYLSDKNYHPTFLDYTGGSGVGKWGMRISLFPVLESGWKVGYNKVKLEIGGPPGDNENPWVTYFPSNEECMATDCVNSIPWDNMNRIEIYRSGCNGGFPIGFTPDVDIRTSLAIENVKLNNNSDVSTPFNYYDININNREFKETTAPIEVRAWFYKRKPDKVCSDDYITQCASDSHCNGNVKCIDRLFSERERILFSEPSNTYIFRLDWGDGSDVEYDNIPFRLGNRTPDNVVNHSYSRAGVYEITGYMFVTGIEYDFDDKEYNPIGIMKTDDYPGYKKFKIFINLNRDDADENLFTSLGGRGYKYIPHESINNYKKTTPIIGGASKYSIYSKSIKNKLGYIYDGDIQINTTWPYYIDKLDAEYAIASLDDMLIGDEISRYTGSNAPPQITDLLDIHGNIIDKTKSSGFYSGSSVDNYGDINSTMATLIHSGNYKNYGELGSNIGNINIGGFNYFQRGNISIWETLGFTGSDAGVPYNPRHWTNIISDDTLITDRSGIIIDGDNMIITESDPQTWNGGYYYPVLPKLDKYGKFDESLGLQGNNIPFGETVEWDGADDNSLITSIDYQDYDLLISLNFNNINNETISDNSGNDNIGIVIGDYIVKYSDDKKPSNADDLLYPKIKKDNKGKAF